jgi:hypothetical protein
VFTLLVSGAAQPRLMLSGVHTAGSATPDDFARVRSGAGPTIGSAAQTGPLVLVGSEPEVLVRILVDGSHIRLSPEFWVGAERQTRPAV